MIDIRDVVSSNLAQLRREQAKTRVLRAKCDVESCDDLVEQRLEEELRAYIDSPPVPRPVIHEPIETAFFDEAPPPPAVNRDDIALTTLTYMYPIGQRDEKTWYIVSPVLYMDQICEYNKDWENHQIRIKAVLFHAARLMVCLERLLNKNLPYPIKIEGSKVTISRKGREYDAVWYENLRDFFIAINSMNANAYYLGGVGKSNLLENLRAAMLPYTRQTDEKLSASLFLSVEH